MTDAENAAHSHSAHADGDSASDHDGDGDYEAPPGWGAIDAALAPLYPGIEPYHLGTIIKWRLGGPDPLDGVSVYQREDHWHYVSYGMSELYEKETEFAEISGWGFEFTFRAARHAGEEHGPVWAANMLQNLARYVYTTGNFFAPGHYMTLNGPISLEDETTLIRNVAFCVDPELGEIDTPHGRLTFLQVVGLSDAEYEAAQAWSTEKLLDTLQTRLPLLVTDPRRGSLLDDPAVAQAVAEGTARDGSSAGSTYATQLEWENTPTHTRIVLGALAAPKIATALRGRLPFGRDFGVYADGRELHFLRGEELTMTGHDGVLHVSVPPGLVEALLGALSERVGSFAVAPELTVQIIPTEIKDQAGEVLSVVGE